MMREMRNAVSSSATLIFPRCHPKGQPGCTRGGRRSAEPAGFLSPPLGGSTSRAAEPPLPPNLGVSLLLPDEAVGGQAQLGHARVPRVLHQRADLVGLGDVVGGAGGKKKKGCCKQNPEKSSG